MLPFWLRRQWYIFLNSFNASGHDLVCYLPLRIPLPRQGHDLPSDERSKRRRHGTPGKANGNGWVEGWVTRKRKMRMAAIKRTNGEHCPRTKNVTLATTHGTRSPSFAPPQCYVVTSHEVSELLFPSQHWGSANDASTGGPCALLRIRDDFSSGRDGHLPDGDTTHQSEYTYTWQNRDAFCIRMEE